MICCRRIVIRVLKKPKQHGSAVDSTDDVDLFHAAFVLTDTCRIFRLRHNHTGLTLLAPPGVLRGLFFWSQRVARRSAVVGGNNRPPLAERCGAGNSSKLTLRAKSYQTHQ